MTPNYCIESGEVVTRDAMSGAELWRGKVCAQAALKCAAIQGTDHAVVLLEAGTKATPLFENLLRVRSNGEVVWAASARASHDSFVDFRLSDELLLATTWNGTRVKLCVESGKLLSEEFVK